MHIYTGIVKEGMKRASSLGFPTMNISLEENDVSGIYAARVKIDTEIYIAAAFADPNRKVLEAYILDFPPRGLYGGEVTVELHKKIRDTKKFTDDTALRTAIDGDVKKVREFFNDPSV